MTKSFNTGQALARAKKAIKKGKFSEALQIYDAVLSHQPLNTVARQSREKLQNIILHGNGQPTTNPSQEQINILIHLINSNQSIKAEQACKELLTLHPEALVVLNILSGSLALQGKLKEAVQICDRMVQLKPDFSTAYYNRGVALQQLHKYEDAMESFSAAIRYKSDYAQAHSDLSLMMLLLGDFKEGWKEHEWRMMSAKEKSQIPAPYKKWSGEDLDNKVILVRAEQGIGDEVMFSSCLPDLIGRKPKKIIVECDSRLVKLLKRSLPELEVQGKRKEENLDWLKTFGNIDLQVAIGSLPLFFRADITSFPDRKSFLQPDQRLARKWKQRLSELGDGMKIGISWRGGSTDSLQANRTIDLDLWAPILQLDAHYINLQYGDCSDDVAHIERMTGVIIHDWEDANPLIDLDNFSAQISELDLVVSIDNSTVHFAGAVGTPTWVLISMTPDWRWMLDRSDSPWYSSVKLFRQHTPDDWTDVIMEIKTELNNCMTGHSELI